MQSYNVLDGRCSGPVLWTNLQTALKATFAGFVPPAKILKGVII